MNVSQRVVLMRDPAGQRYYTGKWQFLTDPNNLTTKQYLYNGNINYQSIIDYDTTINTDPDQGTFFLDINEFLTSMTFLYVANYTNYLSYHVSGWYTNINDDGTPKYYNFTLN